MVKKSAPTAVSQPTGVLTADRDVTTLASTRPALPTMVNAKAAAMPNSGARAVRMPAHFLA